MGGELGHGQANKPPRTLIGVGPYMSLPHVITNHPRQLMLVSAKASDASSHLNGVDIIVTMMLLIDHSYDFYDWIMVDRESPTMIGNMRMMMVHG